MRRPTVGERQGIIGEAKIRHPLTGKIRDDVARLAKKIADLSGTIPKLSIANDLVVTRTGLLVYDAQPFDSSKLSESLSALEQTGLTRAQYPRQVLVLAPDTLVGLADAVGAVEPTEYYWPPFDTTGGEWGRSAPPQQVAAGMLAWRTGDGTITLWLRDPQDHDDDIPALTTIAWEWRINVDRIVCSSVTRDRWRTIADRWRKEAARSQDREIGRVPEAIEPRGLSFQSLTAFVDRWGAAA